MTQEQQTKALAELDGWNYDGLDFANREQYSQCGLTRCLCDLPEYLTSYDAIIPLIQKQDLHGEVLDALGDMRHSGYYTQATPAQLCEALLRATNRWTE